MERLSLGRRPASTRASTKSSTGQRWPRNADHARESASRIYVHLCHRRVHPVRNRRRPARDPKRRSPVSPPTVPETTFRREADLPHLYHDSCVYPQLVNDPPITSIALKQIAILCSVTSCGRQTTHHGAAHVGRRHDLVIGIPGHPAGTRFRSRPSARPQAGRTSPSATDYR